MAQLHPFVYHIKIQLAPDEPLNPQITRQIQVPGGITFHELHKAIMAVFQWGWNEANYGFFFKPAARFICAKEPVVMEDCTYSSSKETYLAEVVETPEFSANLVYTYITIHGQPYEHKISVVRKTQRWTKEDDLCIFTQGTGHCMAEGLTPSEWQTLTWMYRFEPLRRRTVYENHLAEWYEQTCTNGNPLGLGGSRVDICTVKTGRGEPLGTLGAEHGCVVPAEKAIKFSIPLAPSIPPRPLGIDRPLMDPNSRSLPWTKEAQRWKSSKT